MKEYWVNVYKDEGIGAMHHVSLKDAIYSSSDGGRNRAIYRLHVKIKSKRGLTRAYPFRWNTWNKPRYEIHEKWLDW